MPGLVCCIFIGILVHGHVYLTLVRVALYDMSMDSVLFFSRVNLSCFTHLSYYLCCHQSPKRGRLKASRPSRYVSVIDDNHYCD